MSEWQLTDTTTHQHHVIAHVIGATALAHFIFDETVHLLLDIGFIWTIFLDAQMTLLPQGVAVAALGVDADTRSAIQREVDHLLSASEGARLSHLTAMNGYGAIETVELFEGSDKRRLLLMCEETNLAIETSLTTAEIKIYDY